MARYRMTAAWLTKRNGAWLVQWADPSDTSTPDALSDCASSEAVARRLCRKGARDLGFEGGQWTQSGPTSWTLDAWWDQDEDLSNYQRSMDGNY